MKLRNKKTGKILETARSSSVIKDKFRIYDELADKYYTYTSLAELNEEWEDYEAGYYKFTPTLLDNRIVALIVDEKATREEAEKLMVKLKAYKRLKDKGFRFDDYHIPAGEIHFDMEIPIDSLHEIAKDMDVCFGGKE